MDEHIRRLESENQQLVEALALALGERRAAPVSAPPTRRRAGGYVGAASGHRDFTADAVEMPW
jgi:hypothetical protein